MTRRINIVLFGIGNAGSALINKVIKNRKDLALDNHLDFRFPVITNSDTAFFEKEGVNYSWEANFIQFGTPFKIEDVLLYLMENNLENIIAVDASPSVALAAEYPDLIKSGFNLVSINNSLQNFPAPYKKSIEFLAGSRDLRFKYITLNQQGKEAAANALYEAILEIADNKKAFAS